jgi:glycosyltransferase involved in cell wall biosynthesis
MKIIIIYDRYYDYNGSVKTIGGIQTYLHNLSNILNREGYEVIICQRALRSFEVSCENYKVIGFSSGATLPSFKQLAFYMKMICDLNADDLIIWGTEDISFPINFCKTLAIQHGISFDIYREDSKLVKLLYYLKLSRFLPLYQLLRYRKALTEISNAPEVVCVDYNYPNWLRTIDPCSDVRLNVIPNFTKLIPFTSVEKKLNRNGSGSKIKVLFARRFFKYRGVDLMIELTEKIMTNFPSKFQITFAGDGPKYVDVRSLADKYEDVYITSYDPDKSHEFHYDHDIALVPSIGSEGTSFSLLEAMASGCYCISSNAGGLTNIIIDGYNGRIVRATVDDFYEAIIESTINYEKINEQVRNAYNTVSQAFSLECWSRRWLSVIDGIKHGKN